MDEDRNILALHAYGEKGVSKILSVVNIENRVIVETSDFSLFVLVLSAHRYSTISFVSHTYMTV